MNNTGKIYVIKNLNNNKEYVGCTITTINRRFEEHTYRCLNSDSNTKLCNSIRKHGIDNFTINMIEECAITNIYEREKYYINELKTFENGLNSTLGGEGCLGYTHSEQVRKKISNILKNGKSHKGKTYEEIYGDRYEEEKNIRKQTVKKKWESMTEEDRENRIQKTINKVREKSTYGYDLIKEIKDKFRAGLAVKEVKKDYPNIPPSYLYALKSNKRWKGV